jgi:threonine dehydrogenase-like Zn-dependent dehydrogenase
MKLKETFSYPAGVEAVFALISDDAFRTKAAEDSKGRNVSTTVEKDGADTVVDISEQDPVALIESLTDGYGADVYIEGTGHPSAVGQGLAALRKHGRFVEYSVFKDDVTVDWSIISDDKELDVLGAHLGPHCWPAAAAMIESGALPLDRIVTHELPVADFRDGLDLVEDGRSSVKVSLIPA